MGRVGQVGRGESYLPYLRYLPYLPYQTYLPYCPIRPFCTHVPLPTTTVRSVKKFQRT